MSAVVWNSPTASSVITSVVEAVCLSGIVAESDVSLPLPDFTAFAGYMA
ncbi:MULTISPECIES: hypothetical protein [Bacteroides]|nr:MULTISPECIES: hypothetical protein [Bacteroides]MCS2335891.1 hypothetical protein [Bacteroides sp. BFG-606]MCS2629163.1 hypothetical protein [Bacteroides thetaiotaomicron]MCS2719298.1 hypothetical protein [Bacteroides thetaiotaomicron]MCS2827246.1 hypothetical protein [Bacteroides thetaiotaomicron]MDC7299855.1 hypothetical protein [Bacteroides thetaiotaomicron]